MIQELEFLRYPQQIPLDSFDEPNFQLVADILYWLSHRFDPFGHVVINDSIKTEQDRVKFITTVVQSFGRNTLTSSSVDAQEMNGIILDAKQLYLSMDGAVTEILKITKYLIDAIHLQTSHRQANSKRNRSFRKDTSSLMHIVDMEKIKHLRKIISQMVEDGSNFYSSIMKRMNMETQNEQDSVIDFFQVVSNTLNEKAGNVILVQEKLFKLVESKKQELIALEDDTSLLHAKLGDARVALKTESRELERNKERLQSLLSMKPAYMDDIDRLELDLQNHYELYMERYRNLHYLKAELEKMKRIEDDLLAESAKNMKKLQLTLHEEDRQTQLGTSAEVGNDRSIVSPNRGENNRDKKLHSDDDLSVEKSSHSSDHSTSSILISTGSTSSPSMGSEDFISDIESPRNLRSNFNFTGVSESEDDNF